MQSKNSSQTEMNLLQAFAGESQANRSILPLQNRRKRKGTPR